MSLVSLGRALHAGVQDWLMGHQDGVINSDAGLESPKGDLGIAGPARSSSGRLGPGGEGRQIHFPSHRWPSPSPLASDTGPTLASFSLAPTGLG